MILSKADVGYSYSKTEIKFGYDDITINSYSYENNVLTIKPKGSEWIYLENIKPYNGGDTLFNGIINLSVQEGKELNCYAFMFSNDVKARIESDFNLYDCKINNCKRKI